MGMGTVNASAKLAVDVLGTGDTDNSTNAILCRIALTAAERGARFKGEAISSAGDHLDVDGLGFMIPEVGWVLHSESGTGLTFSLSSGASVDLIVEATPTALSWIGAVHADFIQDYSPA